MGGSSSADTFDSSATARKRSSNIITIYDQSSTKVKLLKGNISRAFRTPYFYFNRTKIENRLSLLTCTLLFHNKIIP